MAATTVCILVAFGWSIRDYAGADGNIDLTDIGYLPALDNVCADFVSVGIPMLDDGEGSGSIHVPGQPIVAVLEWAGHEDTTPGGSVSTLLVEVTAGPNGLQRPVEISTDALPAPAGVSIVPPPDNEPVYAWAKDVSPSFASPGSYDIRISGWDSLQWFDEGIASWGSTLTVLYDTGPCTGPVDISWRSGADVYWGGTTAAEEQLWGNGIAGNGHVTEPFVFPIDAAAEERVLSVQFTTGGNSQVAAGCREVDLWFAAGSGAPATADLVTFTTYGQPFGTAATGGVEIVRNPFSDDVIGGGACAAQLNPTDSVYEAGHPCPNGAVGTCPYRAVAIDPPFGGNLGPEWAKVRIDVVVPPGATWLSFQLESPTDQFATTGASPESGAWAGQVLLRIPTPTAPIEITKAVSGAAAGLVAQSVFEITLDCDNDAFDQTVLVTAGETAVVDAVPIGTTCSAAEHSVPAALPGYQYDPPSITPSVVTVSAGGEAVAIVVDNPLRRQFGSIEVTKSMSGIPVSAPGTYGFTLDCDDDSYDTAFSIAAGETFASPPIAVGTLCTVTEVSVPPLPPGLLFDPVVFTPASTVEILEADQVIAVVAENPVRRATGSLTVTKVLSGDVVGYRPGTAFELVVDCDDDRFDASFSLTPVESYESGDIPMGTTCSVSELPGSEPSPGFGYDPPVFIPSSTVTVSGVNTLGLVVDNPIRRRFGSIEVVKRVSGDPAGLVVGSIFEMELDCDDDAFDTSFELGADETYLSQPIAVGVSCLVTETGVAAPGEGFVYEPPIVEPSTPVTISTEGELVTVLVENRLRQQRGRIEVTKVVSGDTGGLLDGSVFAFTLDCDGEMLDTVFELAAGERFVLDDVPVGVTCTVAETAVPATAPGFVFGSPTYRPSATVTVADDAQSILVEVDNPLEQTRGGLAITKNVVGEAAGHVPGSAFGFSMDCDGDAHDGSFWLAAAETLVVEDLPIGMSCTIREVEVAAPADGFVYGEPVVTPDSSVRIDDGTQMLTVVFDNPLRQLAGSIEITKVVSGASAGYPAGSVFEISIDCDDDGFDQLVSVVADETVVIDGLPTGTTCLLSETGVPDPLPGFEYGPPSIVPDEITIDGTVGVAVVVENPVATTVPETGRIAVTKVIDGPTEGHGSDVDFGFALSCDTNADAVTFTLRPGERFTSEPMPVGTICTVAETAVPPAATGFAYGPPIFEPAATVAIEAADQTVLVVVRNPLVPELVATGRDSWPVAGLGLGLIGAGVVVIGLEKRRQRR